VASSFHLGTYIHTIWNTRNISYLAYITLKENNEEMLGTVTEKKWGISSSIFCWCRGKLLHCWLRVWWLQQFV